MKAPVFNKDVKKGLKVSMNPFSSFALQAVGAAYGVILSTGVSSAGWVEVAWYREGDSSPYYQNAYRCKGSTSSRFEGDFDLLFFDNPEKQLEFKF